MNLYARIDAEGVVIETFRYHTDPTPLFDPSWTWVECPPETVQRSVFDGENWAHPDPQPEPEPAPQHPTEAMVIAERERRLALGFDYDFGDERGTHRIGTMPEDIRKWNDEVTPLANAMMLLGLPEGTISIRTNTGKALVTAQEWLQILVAAGEWRQPIYQASFDLMEMDPIPADYTDDKWWTPAVPENE